MRYSIFFKKKPFLNKIYYILRSIILGKNLTNGPEMVINSLIPELKRRKIIFNINPLFNEINQNVIILSDHKILKKLILLKKIRKFKLFAGPNISILPTDYSKLLLSPGIDKVLVPSEWVKKLYIEKSKNLKDKIYVWPSAIDVSKFNNKIKIKKKYDFLVYIKFFKDKNLLDQCLAYLNKHHQIKIISYGRYKINFFYSLLAQSKYSIFFSESESQGIMYFESWAANVSSLVFNKKKVYKKGLSTLAIPCPYLDERHNGLAFVDFASFKKKIKILIKQNKKPRKWLINNYSMKQQASKILAQFKN